MPRDPQNPIPFERRPLVEMRASAICLTMIVLTLKILKGFMVPS
jgi:hypothetical protein